MFRRRRRSYPDARVRTVVARETEGSRAMKATIGNTNMTWIGAAFGVAATLLTTGCDAQSNATDRAANTASASVPSRSATAARRLNDGLWETVTTVNGHAMPPARNCITKATADEVNGDDASVRRGLAQTNPAPGCEVQNVEIKGSRIAFDTICDGQTVHSVITYDGDRYAGEMTAAGMGVMALSAHRVGACPVRQGG